MADDFKADARTAGRSSRRAASEKLHWGRLDEGRKEAVTTVLSSMERAVGVQGCAGTGRTAMPGRSGPAAR